MSILFIFTLIDELIIYLPMGLQGTRYKTRPIYKFQIRHLHIGISKLNLINSEKCPHGKFAKVYLSIQYSVRNRYV